MKEALRLGLPGIPTFAFWNLNTYPKGIQGESTCKGMEFYQGYSKGNIRHLFCGADETATTQELDIDGVTHTVTVSSTTPFDKMNKVLYSKFFDGVRAVFSNTTTGRFASYHFERELEQVQVQDKVQDQE